jgi:tetratricopeptide (TPR) repeat protein
MIRFDARDCSLSGASEAALAAYEQALAALLGWRTGSDALIAQALKQAPDFVMAHVLQAYSLLCSRDPRRVHAARPVLAQASGLPANDRERRHLAAIATALADDYEGAKARLGELLRRHPHDVLALHAVVSLDYATGDIAAMNEHVATALPAWTSAVPGYHAVLAMQAFGLVESGDYEHAEQAAREALALNPLDARAHHVMAHVFEMTDRAEAGLRWMHEHRATWADSVSATHCWWHLALFHLTLGEVDRALALYDEHVRGKPSSELSDLIDAAALLWRLRLHDVDAGTRWAELAHAWAAHIDDGYCSFSDVHAMLAFVGARDGASAERLETFLLRRASAPTRHGETTRQLGLPAARALIAFGRGDLGLAITLLASLPTLAHRLGGSHAQRDVLHLTLLHAVDAMRRPVRRGRAPAAPSGRPGAGPPPRHRQPAREAA